jgi:hypothetical protein
MTSSSWQKIGPVLIGGLGLLLLGALYYLRDEDPRPTGAESRLDTASVAPDQPRTVARVVDRHEQRAVGVDHAVARAEPAPRYAHPHTVEHARIYRDVDLLENAKDALARRDFVTARAILAQHRIEFPNGYPERVEGYEIIADCLENPGPETTARAQRYHDEKRASIVRRQVRKACLKAPS